MLLTSNVRNQSFKRYVKCKHWCIRQNIDVLCPLLDDNVARGCFLDALTKSAVFRIYALPPPINGHTTRFLLPPELKNAFCRAIRFPPTEEIGTARNARSFINRMTRTPVTVWQWRRVKLTKSNSFAQEIAKC